MKACDVLLSLQQEWTLTQIGRGNEVIVILEDPEGLFCQLQKEPLALKRPFLGALEAQANMTFERVLWSLVKQCEVINGHTWVFQIHDVEFHTSFIANILFRCHFKLQCGSLLCVSCMPTWEFPFGSQESPGSRFSRTFSALHVFLHELPAQKLPCCFSPRVFSHLSSPVPAVLLFLET